MRRREFIALFGGAAASWPLAVYAQQRPMPVIGFVNAASPGPLRQQIAAFREGLKNSDYVEGQNVAVEYRWAEGQYDRLPALVADLVRQQVSVIVAGVTGVYQFTSGLEAKRLGLLHEMLPKATPIAVLINPKFMDAENQLSDVQEAAARLGVQLIIVRADAESDFDAAFSDLVRQRAGALLVSASPFFNTRREQLVVLAARHAVPAIFEWRDFAVAGGLMSYGTSLADAYRQVGVYAGQILKGAKPVDLPVVQSTRFELVINMSTAKALGVDVPPTLIARADEVIE